MKSFLEAVLYSSGNLKNRIEEADRIIQMKVLKSFEEELPTKRIADKIIELLDYKKKLFILKGVYVELFKKMDKEEKQIYRYRYIQQKKYGDFGEKLKLSRRTFSRRVEGIENKLESILNIINFDEEYFINNFLKYQWIGDFYERTKRLEKRMQNHSSSSSSSL